MKQRKIEDEIAETLRKIHEREQENVKRYEEERKQKEEKLRKENEIKNKIQDELNKILQLEAQHAQQVREQERIRENARLKVGYHILQFCIFCNHLYARSKYRS